MVRRVTVCVASLVVALALGASGAFAQTAALPIVEIRVGVAVATSTALNSDANPSLVGETVAFRASVSPTPGTRGTVTFFVDGAAQSSAVGVDANGTAVFRTGTLAAGDHTIKARYNGDDGGNPSTSAELQHTVQGRASPPTIVSGPTAGVATGVVGQPVVFTVTATGTQPILYTWDFGDGVMVTTNSTNVLHTFSAPLTYTVTVTVSDSANQTTSGTISFPVAAAATPPRDPWMVVKTSVALNFKTPGKDKLSVLGVLELPAGFDPSGKTMTVDFGGVAQTFLVDGKGMAKTGKDQFKLTRKLQNKQFLGGASKVQFALSGSLAATLADDGLTNETITKPGKVVSVPVLFGIDNQIYAGTAWIIWTAVAGKSGKGTWQTAVK
ncbi:MAG: Ig-like domain repeat protein [Planctomycetota bacterium]|nr:Ig-like domain repeat protein [Planctomycetota bacterium]